MKKLAVLLITVLVIGCHNDASPFSKKDELPAETQIGANTIGCLLNGQVFLPKNSAGQSGINVTYEYFNGGNYFNMSWTAFKNNGDKTLQISLQRTELQLGVIQLNKPYINDVDVIGGTGAYLDPFLSVYSTNEDFTGEINFTRVDLNASIVSGTFWFNAANSAGEIVSVQSGRFDLHL